MPSPWAIVCCSIIILPSLLLNALPINESALASSASSEKNDNGSMLVSASSQSHSQPINEIRPVLATEDSENPSLLTSIPTFAPPAAIKGRGDNRKNGGNAGNNGGNAGNKGGNAGNSGGNAGNNVGNAGIHVPTPIPTVSFGIPSVRTIRRYVSDRLRGLRGRSPTAQNTQSVPPVSTDAIQPHKAPVSDSTIKFVKDRGNPSIFDEAETNEGESDTASNEADDSGNAIQNMASPGAASETLLQPEGGIEAASEKAKHHSLSHSLGTISHTQFEEEDSGKRRRRRRGTTDEGKRQRPARDVEDGGYREQTLEDYEVPTIWNGQVNIKDLDWFELHELDHWLDTLAYAEKHGKKNPSMNFPSTSPKINSTTLFSPALNNTSTPLPSPKGVSPAPPPKSLAKSLRLKPHSSSANKTKHGNRRNEIPLPNLDQGVARGLQESRFTESIQTTPTQEGIIKFKREDADPVLDTVDISDEAYDQFRKDHPSFFGEGW